MFGISGFELLVVLVIAVIFVKTEDIPKIAQKAGSLTKKLRLKLFDVKSTISKELNLDDSNQHKTTTIIDINGQPRSAFDVKEVFKDLEK